MYRDKFTYRNYVYMWRGGEGVYTNASLGLLDFPLSDFS